MTNERLSGDRTIKVNTPLNETPLFVKASSIIPFGPKVQYATQETDEPLTIRIYPGKDAEFVLYLDDNESYDYEQGEYSEINFSYTESTKEITIKLGNGNYINFKNEPLELNITKVGSDAEVSIIFNGEEIGTQLE